MIFKQKMISEVEDVHIGPLQLTSGEVLDDITLRYERVGPRNAPVILACHALTGNHLTVGTEEQLGWWSGLISEKNYIDTQKFQIITFNVLGGCDGSTGPLSINPKTQSVYRASFPDISIRDMVNAQYLALKKLNIDKLHTIIGGSLGGMQVFEWGLCYPEVTEKLIMLATTPVFSDYGIAFNHIAKTVIKNDPNWNGGFYETHDNITGLEVARMIGMITYRSSDLFSQRFNRSRTDTEFDVTSYLNYQGQKLKKRFDANSYLYLLNAMNQHDIGREYVSWQQACEKLSMPILMLSFDKDLIYEPKQMKTCTEFLPNGDYHHIETDFGHDGFLVEFDKWGPLIKTFLNK